MQRYHARQEDFFSGLLELIPGKIKAARQEQIGLALQIHEEKCEQANVLRTLYSAVQTFIDSHSLAKDKLRLEFRAELTNDGFSERFLSMLALNHRGSFMGVDEGRKRVNGYIQQVRWDDAESIEQFLLTIDDALHFDRRADHAKPLRVNEQLVKGRNPEEVYDMLYGLEYVRPRYILRWEGKDIQTLSAGERGTLLLVFYLLVDKSEQPLIIDQPEGNLDNHTIAKVLVECIREARNRRQVFIVTHNPNLAVVCDADQVIHARMDKSSGNAVTYTSGSLESPTMNQYITDVLEGTRWAFGVRDKKYKVGE
jgi:hypothetical protein